MPPDQQKQNVTLKGFVTDFEIRWNTIYFKLDQFLLYSSVVTNITQNPSNKIRNDMNT